MAKLTFSPGATSKTVNIFIADSASTTGAGKTGIAYNAAGLTAYYVRPRASAVAITLATQTVTGSYSSGGFVEVDATNMPGIYRFDIPDAALAAGVDSVAILLKGASGMAPVPLEIDLGAFPLQPTTAGRTLDVSATGEADANLVQISGADISADGPIPLFGVIDKGTAQAATATTLQLRAGSSFANDTAISAFVMAYGSDQGYWQTREITDYVGATDTATVDTWQVTPSGTITYYVFAGAPSSASATAALVDAVWDEATSGHSTAGTTGKALTDAGSAGDPWSTALPGAYSAGSAGYIVGTNLNATVSSRLASASYTAPLDAAGTRSAVGLASANLDTQIGAVKTDTAAILDDTGTSGVKVATGGIASGGIASAELNNIADALLDRNMATGTDSGSTTVRTPRQALRALRNKVSVSGGTATVYKENDSTSSWTAAVTTSAGDPISEIDPA